jgi:hypothetical protein
MRRAFPPSAYIHHRQTNDRLWLTFGFILSVSMISMACAHLFLSGRLLSPRFFGVLGCDLRGASESCSISSVYVCVCVGVTWEQG